jgi:hypothetical protein
MLTISSDSHDDDALFACLVCEGTGNFGFWTAVVRDLERVLQLFRIESEYLKLLAPFGRRIAEPLDADAAVQGAF